MEEVRHVMGVPEWFLSVDSRKITLLHSGACVQMLIHFKGPLAHQMELDLSRLIAGGKLDSPTLNIHGYVSEKRKKVLAYRACGVRDPNEKSGVFFVFYSDSFVVVFTLNFNFYVIFRTEKSIWRTFH